MSETAKRLFDGLKNGVTAAVEQAAPSFSRFASEVGAEGKRLWTQGAMEIVSGLYTGNGFVPYGPGQYTPSPEHDHQTNLASALFSADSFGPYGPAQDGSMREQDHHQQHQHEHQMEIER